MAERFVTLCERFAAHFRDTVVGVVRAEQYVSGLMQARKKNMERMAEVVPEADDQQLQHFLANTRWDERAVRDQVALEADKLLGSATDAALVVDESGFSKKGAHSVGVSRQWNGRLGKVDNCQVGVFVALANGSLATLVDVKLFLPKSWVTDRERCSPAGVPRAARVAKTKPELALEMIRHNRELGVRFGWVLMDGLYGNDPVLLRSLDEDGEVFVVDVHKNQRVYLDDPDPRVPATPAGQRGRKCSKLVAACRPVEVAAWAQAQPDEAWEPLTLRDSSKGELRVEVLRQEVWLWDKKEPGAHRWQLIVRREVECHSEVKYGITNAPEGTDSLRLARMQAQRYWIERSFQDGKSHAGLADYQVRGWTPWHRHMTLVMMAMLFMLEEKVLNQADTPLLSCADVEVLLASFLPRRDIDPEEVLRQLQVRHRKRQASIDQAYARQRLASQRAPST